MPLIPKVAHEGNPRRFTLDIPGGSLLSDPIRTVNQGSQTVGGLPEPSPDAFIPPPEDDIHSSASCSGVFTGGILFSFFSSTTNSPVYAGNDTGGAVGHGLANDTFIQMTTGPDCYGMMWSEHPNVVSTQDVALKYPSGNIQVEMGTLNPPEITGSPYIGVIVYVAPESTINQTTMWGLLYDFDREISEVRYWINEPVMDGPLNVGGTLVATKSVAATDILTNVASLSMQITTSPGSLISIPEFAGVGGTFTDFTSEAILANSYGNGGGGIICLPTPVTATFKFFDHQKTVRSAN